MDIGNLSVSLEFVASGLEAGVQAAQESLEGLQDTVDRLDNTMASSGGNTSRAISDNAEVISSANGSAALSFATLSAAAGMAFGKIMGAIGSGISAINEYKSAVTGLRSVANYKNIGQAELSKGLDQLTDKFFTVTEASRSLKNLLSRGYSMDEAVATITRLKDAAAFGRQANLQFGEAVVSATEGIKNENSILVDNAGVTKNVAKMWEDYAKAHNKSITALTQSEKVQAEINGIMQETVAQTGDLAKMGDSLAGTQADTAQSTKLLAESFGEAMTPAVGFVETIKSGLLKGMRDIINISPSLTAGVTASGLAFTGLFAAVKGVQTINQLSESLKLANNAVTIFGRTFTMSLSGVGAAAGAIGLITLALTFLINKSEEAKRKQEELQNSIKQSKDNAKHIKELADRYEELNGKTNKSLADFDEMQSIQQTLADSYGVTAGAIDGLTGSYWSLAEAANAAAQAQLKAAAGDSYNLSANKLNAYKNNAAWEFFNTQKQGGDWNAFLKNNAKVPELKAEWKNAVSSVIDAVDAEMTAGGVKIDANVARMGRQAMLSWAEAAIPQSSEVDDVTVAMKNIYTDFVKNSNMPEVYQEMEGFKQKVLNGAEITDADVDKFVKNGQEYTNMANAVYKQMFEETQNEGLAREAAEKILTPFYDEFNNIMRDEKGNIAFDKESFFDLFSGAEIPNNILDNFKKYQELANKSRVSEILSQDTEARKASIQAMQEEITKKREAWEKSQNLANETKASMDFLQAAEKEYDWEKTWDNQSDKFKEYMKTYQEETGQSIGSAKEFGETIYHLDKANTAYTETATGNYNSLMGTIADFGGVIDGLKEGSEEKTEGEGFMSQTVLDIEKANDTVPKLTTSLSELQGIIKETGKAFDPATASAEECAAEYERLNEKLTRLKDEHTQVQNELGKIEGWKNAIKGAKDGKKGAQAYQKALKEMGLKSNTSLKDATKYVENYANSVIAKAKRVDSDLQTTQGEFENLASASNISAEVQVETGGAIGAISALIGIAEKARKILSALGLVKGTSGGGGGGGKKDSVYQKALKEIEHGKKMDTVDLYGELAMLNRIRSTQKLSAEEQMDLAERIYAVKKAIHEKELQDAYDLIEHKKDMEQINTEQEIQMLEDMARKHWFTNKERMEYDRKLFEARKRLREENEEKVSGMGEGIVQALRKQYEQMKETETKALNESKDAIQKWADERTKAIQSQIDALDKLKSREDEEAKDAKERRKIAKLEEQLNFEQDEYNRAQLQAQIEKAKEDRATRLRRKEIDDQKQALRDQMNAVKDEKDEKFKDIEEQKKKIDEVYQKLMEQNSIEAEARRMLLQKSQEEIVQFIGKFAPEYDALGRSLGKKWLDGFQSVAGNVGKYFDSFNKKLQSIQEQLANQALQLVDNFYKTRDENKTVGNTNTVNQTVNFNQPIETPAEAATKIRRAAEDLVYV